MSGYGQRPRPWIGDPTPSEPAAAAAGDREDASSSSSFKDFGTSVNSISFGFAATAVLISMFLLMAIFEHLIKPRVAPPGSDQDGAQEPPQLSGHPHDHLPSKPRTSPKVECVVAADLSVLMPGQRHPTYLAMPAPLPSCPREGVNWPPHDHHYSLCPHSSMRE